MGTVARFLSIDRPWTRNVVAGEHLHENLLKSGNTLMLTDAQCRNATCPPDKKTGTRVTQLRRLCADLRQRLAEREVVQARLAKALVQQVA